MKMKFTLPLTVLVVIVIAVIWLSLSRRVLTPPPTTEMSAVRPTRSASEETNGLLENQPEVSKNQTGSNIRERAKDIARDPISLSSNNFESSVSRCFQGEPCKFNEDPQKMYGAFKQPGNRAAMDSLISFLRSRMRDAGYRERYKDTLKAMIDDFYPPEEKQFQEAAYYNYLGDLDKSLQLYLDLEKRSLSDSTLRGAPKLNIANTFYDLGRKSEALPYYRAARADYESERIMSGVPSSNEMLRFIDGRIDEIVSQSVAH